MKSQILSFLGALAIVTSFGTVASAADTTCHFNNCLQNGWTINSIQGFTTVHCTNGDCINVGWTTTDPIGRVTAATCKPGGCFVNGWVEAQYFFPYHSFDTVCKAANCMAFGWSTYQYGRLLSDLTCMANSCTQFGWSITAFPSGMTTQSQCKAGACFSYGWVTYP